MNFCFRVEAGNNVGMGHLMESICLANSLRRKNKSEIIFLVNDFTPSLDIIKKSGYAYHIVEDHLNAQDEIDTVLEFVKKYESRVLIIDRFRIENVYLQKIKSGVERLVVILDDAEHRQVAGDLVVNFNIAQDESYYSDLPIVETSYCIGPKYMLLPEELHKFWKKNKFVPEICRTVFVNQGGSDPYGLTIKIIKELESLNLKQKVIVVIGPAVTLQHKKELESLKPNLRNSYQFEWSISQNRMYQLMLESDVAITAAGNTLYELALFGVPSIVVCHHERHNKVASKFEEKKAVINLGIGSDLQDNEIANEVEKLLTSKEQRLLLNHNIKEIVDGLGSKRVAEKILELC